MNSKRKLIVLTISAALCACAAPQEKPQTPPPAAAQAAPPPVAKPKPAPKKDEDTIVILPLGQAAPEPALPAPIAEPAASSDSATAVQASPTQMSSAPAEMKAFEITTEEAASAPASQALPEKVKANPSKPTTVVADKTPREFTITVAKKTPDHPNYGRGQDIGFYVDNVPGEELVLTRGVTYIFHVRTNVKHDFYFTTSPRGRGAGTVSDGVMGQFTYAGDVSFTPTASTPDVMYYECRNHAFMGGKIHIANAGDKVKIGGETIAAPQKNAEKRAVTAAQVKQKLNFVDMMMPSTAKRVDASNNDQAKKALEQAHQKITGAHEAMSGGDNAAAMDAANEAVRLLGEASRLVPSDAGIDYKANFAQLLEQVEGFDNSFKGYLEKGFKPKAGKELDRAGFNGLVREAKNRADRGDYETAIQRLGIANDMITEALSSQLQAQTVVYDKNFKTAKEEYEYELARYKSYLELIPIAIEQRGPLPQTVTNMHKLEDRAKEIHGEAVALADKGDHKKAIMALQAATDKLHQALRMAGVQ